MELDDDVLVFMLWYDKVRQAVFLLLSPKDSGLPLYTPVC